MKGIVAVLFIGMLAHAGNSYAQTENTAQTCQDGSDNDGDGHVDCGDQDCSAFVFCQGAGTGYTGMGWGLGAGIFGFAITAPIVALGLASEIEQYPGCPELPSLPLGASALILHIASAPIVFAGGQSTRRAAGVRGILALRIIGWIAYGLTVVDGIVLVTLGALPDVPLPDGVIGSVTGLALATMLAMSADTIVSWKQARKKSQTALEKSPHEVALFPLLAPVTTERRMTGMSLGLGMIF